jgi:hypothetical protein
MTTIGKFSVWSTAAILAIVALAIMLVVNL